ncbi:hypothetical protein [Pseudonocardia sp. ICBG601]|uniref:hypothetical protein n=1 Tax=Pseudonocardia sp. ICBG601 TaxID=2846759 RepID=UPI0035AC0EA4
MSKALANFCSARTTPSSRSTWVSSRPLHRLAAVRAPPGNVGYEEGGQLTEKCDASRSRWCCSTRSRGAPGDLQHAPAGARGRPSHRRPGRTVDFKNTC